MPFYKVQFVEGGSAATPSGGLNFLGLHGLLRRGSEPSRRLDRGPLPACGARRRHRARILRGRLLPLGFSAEEQEVVRGAGIPLTIGYPRAGCQIERIDGESPTARTGLTLDGLPGMMFTSWEADVAGQWTIYYETDLQDAHTTWCVLESEGAGLVGQARDRFLASGAGASFDLDEARRQAADRIVVSKVCQSLEHLDRQPGRHAWQ